jgi:hypothetical protein
VVRLVEDDQDAQVQGPEEVLHLRHQVPKPFVLLFLLFLLLSAPPIVMRMRRRLPGAGEKSSL